MGVPVLLLVKREELLLARVFMFCRAGGGSEGQAKKGKQPGEGEGAEEEFQGSEELVHAGATRGHHSRLLF